MIDLEKSLLNPKVYDSKTKTVKFKKTWFNFMFFTDKFVYKIKQPISRFDGRIDYRTLADRKCATIEEYKINKKISPSIYVDVVPVQIDVCGNAGINIGGKIIDYALKMKRLPEKQELFELIKLQKIKKRDVIVLAKILRKIHYKLSELSGSRKFMQYTPLQIFHQRWLELFERMEKSYIKKVVGVNFLRRLTAWYDKFSPLIRTSLSERQSFTQRIHGDLSTENIFYVNGKFSFLDAIFLDGWGYGDPLDDVGTIAKDFDAYHQNELDSLFVLSYLEGNNSITAVWFYKIYWAANKYLLHIDILSRTPRNKWERSNIERAELYRDLLERYLKTQHVI